MDEVRMRPIASVLALGAAFAVAVVFGGCECRGLGNDPNAEAEERQVDELWRKWEPPIPMSRAVGCDVCPGHCRHLDLGASLSMAELMARYRRIAVKKTHHPDAWDALLRLACIAGRKGPEGEIEFLEMLYDPREPVRYYAARHALDLAFAIEEPVRVLREIAAGTERYAAHAAARLELWRQERDGEWPPDPHRLKRQKRPHVW